MIKSLKYDTNFLKSQQSVKTSTSHTALAICNSLIHLGSASDSFIRSNVEWISWSMGWGRFIMISSLGVIHKGHGEVVIKIVSPYLPAAGNEHKSAHQEGGAFYAIGLSYSNYGNRITNYFMNHNHNTMDPVAAHGFCLGLGLASMGSHRKGKDVG
ncbi:26S proteasome non-ATPase regulatory subunit 1 [Thelohanellus kitauei]|uniref:26S proteasome non-ATPase regulatory subunit 1 n=1 Tax=Thelohanellus kitauei TaxID=669202 RepID=A0A0C2I5Z8_THEKT|nr:26S proteasome non-ATPase regulatory subunit 1 [Thelohanellus kitauei]